MIVNTIDYGLNRMRKRRRPDADPGDHREAQPLLRERPYIRLSSGRTPRAVVEVKPGHS
jgi:hypothetical protein